MLKLLLIEFNNKIYFNLLNKMIKNTWYLNDYNM